MRKVPLLLQLKVIFQSTQYTSFCLLLAIAMIVGTFMILTIEFYSGLTLEQVQALEKEINP